MISYDIGAEYAYYTADFGRSVPVSGKYTPEQRRKVDAELAKGLQDLKEGQTSGPFNTTDEMIASMKQQLKKRASGKKTKHTR